jgi:hypothetical protein
MTTELLSVGPEDMGEDEQRIAAGYRNGWRAPIGSALLIFGVAYFSELKWVLAVGFVSLVIAINGTESRLYDLCIRIRRTNVLLLQAQK